MQCRIAPLATALALALASTSSLSAPAKDAPAWLPVDDGCHSLVLTAALPSADPFRRGALAGRAQDEGALGLLDLLLCQPLSPETSRFWRAEVRDAGGPQPSVSLALGEAGRWRIEAEGGRLSSGVTQVLTPMHADGRGGFALPAGWVPGATTAAMRELLPSLVPVELERRRGQAELRGRAILGAHLQLDARYRESQQSGLRRFAAVSGNTGGNARAILLAAPLDQRTRTADLGLLHAGPRLQLRTGFYLSHFDNALDALSWQTPFAQVAGWAAGTGSPALNRAQPAPDNRFHQLSLAAGYALSPSLRLNADLAVGQMRQNQAYLDYSAVPALLAALSVPLPRPDLDGRVDTRLLSLRLAQRSDSALRWDARLRIDDRDNRTPVDEYVYISGDSELQSAAANSARRRFNVAPGYRDSLYALGAGWHPHQRFGIDAELAHQAIKRTASARSDSREQRLLLKLRHRVGERFDYGFKLGGADREGSTYLGSRDFVESHSPDYIASVPGAFENLPGLRQYHLADRRRHQVGGFASFAASARSQWNLSLGEVRDDYRASEFGLTDSRVRHVQLDLAQGLTQNLWLNAFAGREWLDAAQRGRAFQGGANRLPQANDPNRNWSVKHADTVDSLGVGLAHRAPGSRLRLRADASLSDAQGALRVTTGSALTSAPLPDTRARLLRVDAGFEYVLREGVELGLHYRLERFDGADFAEDGTAPNTLANVILLGDESPDYRAQAWLLNLRWRF
ncbi:MtrB/PioB family decaheme-associated outer membrane protein [Aquimonas voraii]|uniref:Decaheme-associated outer membrane protein, MtrB/PioB family n=1 Tax=Aquimonas voraii TaxID=265719 RepID=A0A1G6SCP2_9GAMM|nr:MtrB/PioB family decaheme-associated outer membrane protein [Aquimonas voraii]SDD14668.1 decaheme-associated outer membrane protein, MtrB/PioB family [Aquimonas voraii]